MRGGVMVKKQPL